MPNQYCRIAVLILIFFFISISCQSLSFREEEIVRGEEAHYLIKPDTILDDIAQGRTDVFSPQITTPQPALSQSLNVVKWSQEDYLSIVEALHRFVWHESISDWHIRHILFYVKCEDIGMGPQLASFILYKVVEDNQHTSRLEHQISIDPANNSVSWSETEYRPNLVVQNPVELSKYKVSITDALQIAEENGGNKIRLEVDNECFLRAQLINSANYWQVSYVKVLDLYILNIDALTGKFHVINKGDK